MDDATTATTATAAVDPVEQGGTPTPSEPPTDRVLSEDEMAALKTPTPSEPPTDAVTTPGPTPEEVLAGQQAQTASLQGGPLQPLEVVDPTLAAAAGEGVTAAVDDLEGDVEKDMTDAQRTWQDVQHFIAEGRARIAGALQPITTLAPAGAPQTGGVIFAALNDAFHTMLQHLYSTHPASPANEPPAGSVD